jgi:lipoteichoic acid synthase
VVQKCFLGHTPSENIMLIMDISKIFEYFIELRFEFINILLLFALFFVVSLWLNYRSVRLMVSSVGAFLVVLQISSLYFVKTFVGYQFYVHFNVRDIIGMIDIYLFQIVISLLVVGLLICMLYYSRFIVDRLSRYILSMFPFLNQEKHYSAINKHTIRGFVIFVSIGLMSLPGGVLFTSFQLLSMLNTDSKTFNEALSDVGMEDYVLPENIESHKGKNVIILSLESLEKGYLKDEIKHLTPCLRSLKQEWDYFDLKQSFGAEWTSGSLYTTLTGLPAFFGIEGNSIFQKAFHSNITGISHVFKRSGYHLQYLASDANFSGTQEMLYAFQFDEIIDEDLIGKPCRDKDLFERAKSEVLANMSRQSPFVMYIATLDTHFPDGIYDERMEQFVPPQEKNIEFMVSAVDYLVSDFLGFLKANNVLSHTVIYIFPDHLKMGRAPELKVNGERGLYLITNADKSDLTVTNADSLYQIDLAKIILDGAKVNHNMKFFTNYVSKNKNEFIRKNVNELTAVNTSGLLRIDSKPVKPLELSANYKEYKNDTCRFIAHAGGKVNNRTYTNSLEALNENYKKGFRYFELDIIKTSDSEFVAAHDWEHWAGMVSYSGDLPVTKGEFLKYKIYGQLTPLAMEEINNWFKLHRDAVLITDKVNSPRRFANEFIDKKRLIMELFDMKAVKEGLRVGIKASMPSQNVVDDLRGDKVKKMKQLGVDHIAVSRRYIAPNLSLFQELKRNGIKTYVYHLNFDPVIDEDYVVKYEMDNIYGIYADEWAF